MANKEHNKRAHVVAQKSAPSVSPAWLLLKLLLRPLGRGKEAEGPFSAALTLASLAAWVLIL